MIFEDLRKRISNLYYGWRMIGIVSALRVLGGGLHQYGFTVFFLPVTQELGLTRASTSLAFSLARAEGSLAAPIVGYLLDRYGPKPLMFSAALLAGVGAAEVNGDSQIERPVSDIVSKHSTRDRLEFRRRFKV